MNRQIIFLLLVVLVSVCTAFKQHTTFFGKTARTGVFSTPDPNFEAHLPEMLKVGSKERESNVAHKLRVKYAYLHEKKREAAKILKTLNAELAAELEELADELEETTEKFVAASMSYDAWNRPDPQLPQKLRDQKEYATTRMQDPNFEEHLESLLKVGANEDRPSPDLPSDLRMMKLKKRAEVKRRAATELRKIEPNAALAEELDDLADELDEAHERFVAMANAKKTYD